MAPEPPQTKVVPLTCHGHSRPITHLSFSGITSDDEYYRITACKDNHPILRSGTTGDWIGTFLGHKGAVWSARLSHSASLAATGSADFSAKLWDTHTGSTICTLQHNHIVRAVAFPHGESDPKVLATGGQEKKLRLWDLNAPHANGSGSGEGASGTSTSNFTEIGQGIHTSTIKSILFTPDTPNTIVTAAEDATLRWFDIRAPSAALAEYKIPSSVTGAASNATSSNTAILGSAEMSIPAPTNGTLSESIVSVAAGRSVMFFSGSGRSPARVVETFKFDRGCSSVALNLNQVPSSAGVGVGAGVGTTAPVNTPATAILREEKSYKFITGSKDSTWVHVHEWYPASASFSRPRPTGAEPGGGGESSLTEDIEVGKGHHGPVWSTAFSPDGRLYATGSEDGTVKLWKAVEGSWGLWR